MKNSIAIINYGINNIFSLVKAFDQIEVKVEVVDDYKKLKYFSHYVLPGVGSFERGVINLEKKGFIDEIRFLVKKGSFIMGICLGMQLLFECSEENENESYGLSLVKGKCVKFKYYNKPNIRVPHIGWNSVNKARSSKLLKNVQRNSDFYFVHSYYVKPKNPEFTVGVCQHGIKFAAVIESDNILGLQFHPEKCSKNGLDILRQFSLLS